MAPHEELAGPLFAAPTPVPEPWTPTPSAASLLAMERQLQEDPPAGVTWRYHSLQGVDDHTHDEVSLYRQAQQPDPANPGSFILHQYPIPYFAEFQQALANNTFSINRTRTANASCSFRQFWENGVRGVRPGVWLVPCRYLDRLRFRAENPFYIPGQTPGEREHILPPRHIRAVRLWLHRPEKWYLLGDFYGFRWRVRELEPHHCAAEWAAYCGVLHFLPRNLFRVQSGPAAPPAGDNDTDLDDTEYESSDYSDEEYDSGEDAPIAEGNDEHGMDMDMLSPSPAPASASASPAPEPAPAPASPAPAPASPASPASPAPGSASPAPGSASASAYLAARLAGTVVSPEDIAESVAVVAQMEASQPHAARVAADLIFSLLLESGSKKRPAPDSDSSDSEPSDQQEIC
ncbi:hypothetical protein BJ508DRAFT_325599 [Ascobolus immersus RN42]|uniref:Uncharacterized protein n=1 Tax=Ascobolus immersus RN42 TaxID=1160509 RepID=A0A3N4ICE0_ASCIM|nr:hypothetical protein BJ508DRAFT_325599 [Ascobolus immersus RN42]